jgi:alginate O-acetyltransferase complex protein AlgI
MIFSAYWFLIFLCIFVVAFHASPTPKYKSIILAIASLLFYWHFAGPAGVFPILVLGILTYFLALSKKVILLNLGIALCVLTLIFYKYTFFIFENVTNLLPILQYLPISTFAPTVAPLAISFFVFEFIHYIYDVKREKGVITSPLEFLHFSMFFPTLAAGPIKRFEQFVPTLRAALLKDRVHLLDLQYGFLRLISGFVKKLTADSLTLYVGATCAGTGFMGCTIEQRWTIFFAIAMRIYLDFSGYSDMAIGTARMMGIKVPANFNWPYLATSLSAFWQRWHISLSSWIRDYLYVPLGGNRVSKMRHAANLLLVFLVCGLWHGAAWNFVAWGAFHGAGLIAEAWIKALFALVIPASLGSNLVQNSWQSRTKHAVLLFPSWFVTTLFVWSGWLLFFYPPDLALKMFLSLFKFEV